MSAHKKEAYTVTHKPCSTCKVDKPAIEFFATSRIKCGLSSQCRACAHVWRVGYYAANSEKGKAYTAAWQRANSDKVSQYGRAARKRHPEKIRDRLAKYYQEHRAERAAYAVAYAKANPEKVRANCTKWRKANRERSNANSARQYHKNPEPHRARHRLWLAKNVEHVRAYEVLYRENNKEQVRAKNAKWWKDHPDEMKAYANTRRTRVTGAGGQHTAADIRAKYAEQQGRCFYCEVSLHGKFHREHKIPVSRGGTSWPENMACACRTCNLQKGSLTDVEFAERRVRHAEAA